MFLMLTFERCLYTFRQQFFVERVICKHFLSAFPLPSHPPHRCLIAQNTFLSMRPLHRFPVLCATLLGSRGTLCQALDTKEVLLRCLLFSKIRGSRFTLSPWFILTYIEWRTRPVHAHLPCSV